jgi:hypothetical protein
MTRNPYTDWQPLLLETIAEKIIRSSDYRRFLFDAAIVPGCRLLLARHRQRPDWPYVETKFNPNTGLNLPPEKYNLVYTWFLGRGSEALDDHLRRLDSVEAFGHAERAAMRELFTSRIANMTRDLAAIADRHHDRIPFRVNRDLNAVDANGKPAAVDATFLGAGDIFGVKGLLSSTDPAIHGRALPLLRRAADLARRDRFEYEQSAPPPGRDQGTRMLMQGVGACFAHKSRDLAASNEALGIAAAFLTEVLDKHYDSATTVFSECIDPATGARSSLLDPGHANELVGLGLGMIECLEKSPIANGHCSLIARAKRELPRLLIKSTALGFNPRQPGIFKSVNNQTGKPINADMPWWNLPETMRAAVRASVVAENGLIRSQCLEIFRMCHNAYFSQYPNRANMLFPFQTLNGETGRVVDVVPAVPEGDPLYHANGAFMDMLDAAERL